MNEPQTWDMGDEENPPPAEVIGVLDYTAPQRPDDDDSVSWGRVTGSEGWLWKGYKNQGKVYLEWSELLRRWGPVQDSGSRL